MKNFKTLTKMNDNGLFVFLIKTLLNTQLVQK